MRRNDSMANVTLQTNRYVTVWVKEAKILQKQLEVDHGHTWIMLQPRWKRHCFLGKPK